MFLWLLSPGCCIVFIVVCIADKRLRIRIAEAMKCWNLFNLLPWLKSEWRFWKIESILHPEVGSMLSGCIATSYLHLSTKDSVKGDHWCTAAHLLFKAEPLARQSDVSFFFLTVFNPVFSPLLFQSWCLKTLQPCSTRDTVRQYRNITPDAAGLVLMLFWPKQWDRNKTGTTIYSSEIS